MIDITDLLCFIIYFLIYDLSFSFILIMLCPFSLTGSTQDLQRHSHSDCASVGSDGG